MSKRRLWGSPIIAVLEMGQTEDPAGAMYVATGSAQ